MLFNITKDLIDKLIFEYQLTPVNRNFYSSSSVNPQIYQNDQIILIYDPRIGSLDLAPKISINSNLFIDGSLYGYRPFIEENLRAVDEIINYIKYETDIHSND